MKLNNRIIIILILIMIMFIVLSLKLINIQITNKEKYKKLLDDITVDEVYSNSTPRGRIYDRNYNLLVDNIGVKTIYYKRPKNTTTDNEIKLAYLLSDVLDIDYSKLNITNLKEFYIASNKELVDKKITKKEKEMLKQRKISSKDINNLKLERITDKELSKYKEIDKKAAYIYYLMNKGYYYDEKIIKTNATEKEYAYVAEHLSKLKGVNIKLEWERKYLYGDVFRSILGNISSSDSGIPLELKDKYLSKGYKLNDRVGISNLEYQYEDLLKGQKTKYKLNSDNTYTVLKEGTRGHDIVLTIDINIQKEIEKILDEEIVNAKKNNINTTYYNGSHVIVVEPNTGEILAMASKQVVNDKGNYKVYDVSPTLLTNPVTPGSIVKGASMSVGYKTGAINIGTTMKDECIKIRNTPAKCSWSKNLGYLNDIKALAYSSNSYQYKTAIKVAGANYYYNGPLVINESAFNTYREMFKKYGLGEKTNIDLPVESYGFKGQTYEPGHLLDLAIGQYDTYTPVQIASYINTLASNGNKYRLHLLKEIRNISNNEEIGTLKEKIKPTLLDTVDLDQQYKDRIKLGFESVMKTLGYGYMGNVDSPAGKTGTAESFYDSDGDGKIDVETLNKGFIGYAPSYNPKFSLVVLSPNVRNGSNNGYISPVNNKISSRVSNKVFEILQ